MTEEFLIYPMVRRAVSRMVGVAACLALFCACGSAGELVVSAAGYNLTALWLGGASELLMAFFLPIIMWVGLWCHVTLLAGRGLLFTRYLMLVGAVLSVLLPVCELYSMVLGSPLLVRQTDLPIIVAFILLVSVLLNLPRAIAAGWCILTAVSIFAGFLFLYALTNMPQLIWMSDVCKSTACFVIYFPLLRLQPYVRRIVALPPAEA